MCELFKEPAVEALGVDLFLPVRLEVQRESIESF